MSFSGRRLKFRPARNEKKEKRQSSFLVINNQQFCFPFFLCITVSVQYKKSRKMVFDSCLRFPVLEINVIIVFWFIPIDKEYTREFDVVFE